MVQLKLAFLYFSTASVLKFQFHNGTIKTYATKAEVDSRIDFNSIMVQLKLENWQQFIAANIIFQFHNGTIKTHRHL